MPFDVDLSAVWKMLNDEEYAILVEKNDGKISNHWVVYRSDLLKLYTSLQM